MQNEDIKSLNMFGQGETHMLFNTQEKFNTYSMYTSGATKF